jgi:hypothetical protein
MGSELKRILMAIATGVIIYVIIGHFLVQSMWIEGPNPTPTITMQVHKNGSLNYTFTVVSFTDYEILWSDILVEVHHNTASIEAPDNSGFVNFWDEVVITFSSEVETAVLLKYLPTGGVAYSLVFTPLAENP